MSYNLKLQQKMERLLAERVAFLLTEAMTTVVMCRVRNPDCTAAIALSKERYING